MAKNTTSGGSSGGVALAPDDKVAVLTRDGVYRDPSFGGAAPLLGANNLSDVASAATALANLGALASAKAGAPSGVATLDAGSHVPAAQLPAATTSAQGAVELDGTAGDILGIAAAAAAGVSAKAAAADHVHPPGIAVTAPAGAVAPVTVANSTAETVLATYTIAAADAAAGTTYELIAWGYASTAATPNITFSVRLGGVSGTLVVTTGALATASAISGKSFLAKILLTCVTTGVGGTWSAVLDLQDNFNSQVPVATAVVSTQPTVTADSTISEALVLTVTWGTQSASNTITCAGASGLRRP